MDPASDAGLSEARIGQEECNDPPGRRSSAGLEGLENALRERSQPAPPAAEDAAPALDQVFKLPGACHESIPKRTCNLSEMRQRRGAPTPLVPREPHSLPRSPPHPTPPATDPIPPRSPRDARPTSARHH